MFRILYVSRNLIPAATSEAEIERILAVARRRNAERDVTGALLFSEDAFAQALEGPQEAVSGIFDLIQMDARHADVVVLEAGMVAAREFAEWRMAYSGRIDDTAARYATLLGRGPGADAGQGVLRMLGSVVSRLAGSTRAAA